MHPRCLPCLHSTSSMGIFLQVVEHMIKQLEAQEAKEKKKAEREAAKAAERAAKKEARDR